MSPRETLTMHRFPTAGTTRRKKYENNLQLFNNPTDLVAFFLSGKKPDRRKYELCVLGHT